MLHLFLWLNGWKFFEDKLHRSYFASMTFTLFNFDSHPRLWQRQYNDSLQSSHREGVGFTFLRTTNTYSNLGAGPGSSTASTLTTVRLNNRSNSTVINLFHLMT
jgi:hypothetical protein